MLVLPLNRYVFNKECGTYGQMHLRMVCRSFVWKIGLSKI